MEIECIDREPIEGTDAIMTTLVVNGVTSQCNLTRVMIDALGRPGKASDMSFLGSGSRWMVTWTKPSLSIEQVKVVVDWALSRAT